MKTLIFILASALITVFETHSNNIRLHAGLYLNSEYNNGYESITVIITEREYKIIPNGDKVKLLDITSGKEFNL